MLGWLARNLLSTGQGLHRAGNLPARRALGIDPLEDRTTPTNYISISGTLFPVGTSYKCTIDAEPPEFADPIAAHDYANGDPRKYYPDLNVIAATGYFAGTVDFDNGSSGPNRSGPLTSAGNDDIWISVRNPDNSLRWVRRMGGTQRDQGKAVAFDPDGNVYVAGTFRGTADFDPGAGTFNLTSNGSEDIFVTKLDRDGNFLWARSVGGVGTANSDDVQDIAVDKNGAVYVTGGFSGTVDFDPGSGVTNLVTTGNLDHDAYLWKLNADGSFGWARRVGSTNATQGFRETGKELVIGPSEIYVSGDFFGTVDFDPGAGVANLTTGDVNTGNAFVLKLDPAGNYVWARNVRAYAFGGALSEDTRSGGLDVDSMGNVLLGGSFSDTGDFDPGAGVVERTAVGGEDAFVLQLSAAGIYQRVTVFGNANFEAVSDLSLDTLGNILVAGTYQGTIDLDPGAGVANQTSSGGIDHFLLRLDPAGNHLWSGSIGGTGTDIVTSINGTASGGFLITGEIFSNTFDYDPGPGVTNRTRFGNSDAFTITYGAVDDVAGRTAGGEWYFARNDGTGLVSSFAGQWNPAGGWTDTLSADFDNDGENDVASRTSGGQWYVGLNNNGTLTTGLWGQWSAAITWRDVFAADYDRDGRADILGRASNGQWWLARNTGSGTFTNLLIGGWNEGAGWNDVRAADFNRDGFLDIAGRTNAGQWWVSLTVSGSLSPQLWTSWNPAAEWRDVAAADFNGDGRVDLIGRTNTGVWWVARNTNGSSFTNVTFGGWNEGAGWNDVVFGDFNGDGKADVAGRTNAGQWWVGTGNGSIFTFTNWANWAATGWVDVMVGDFNGDGRTDILGRYSNGQWWLARSTDTAFTNQTFGVWNPAAGWVDVGSAILTR
jgi:hypothetical protein